MLRANRDPRDDTSHSRSDAMLGSLERQGGLSERFTRAEFEALEDENFNLRRRLATLSLEVDRSIAIKLL